MTSFFFGYMHSDDVEDIKTKGWRLIHKEECPRKKAEMMIRYVISAHYWRMENQLMFRGYLARDLKKIFGSKYDGQLGVPFPIYASHWMHANIDTFPGPVGKELKKLIKPVKNKYLPDGFTTYQF